MLHRVRSDMRFTASSGLAGWCRDQMDVRYGQAVHIRQGEPDEESPVNLVVDEGEHERFVCDLPLADEAAAVDAVATLSDPNVLGQAVDLDDGEPSWVDRHPCTHDDDREPCVLTERLT